MADTPTNAAIWYAEDGFSPETKGINGRRVAGASFLTGFLRHAQVDEFVGLCAGPTSEAAFRARAEAAGRALPIRTTTTRTPNRVAPVGVVNYPAPNYAEELWRRQQIGHGAYALCGITHTTATRAVTEGMFTLRTAPQMPWDGVICTSKSVLASISGQMDVTDAYLKDRFGQAPPRPQMPVIPLGIDTAAFARDAAARAALRGRMGWSDGDIVITTLSRLSPYGKFDPVPMFLALQAAQNRLGDRVRLHYVVCGIYLDDHSRKVFEDAAAGVMPGVTYLHLDGADAQARAEALSGGDIFAFPIDNVQETFGLAPIEAMAAGLPVICSDWDGMRDTVTPDVGIRVPTLGLGVPHTVALGLDHTFGRLKYSHYTNSLSALTEIDLAGLRDAIMVLALDAEKRAAMGRAAEARARAVYDWAAVIPQMQAFWGELDAIRRREMRKGPQRIAPLPIAPPPGTFFAAYPSATAPLGVARCRAVGAAAQLERLYTLRRYGSLTPAFEKLDTLQRILAAVEASGAAGCDAQEAAKAANLSALTAERCFVWLLKYGLIARLPKGAA